MHCSFGCNRYQKKVSCTVTDILTLCVQRVPDASVPVRVKFLPSTTDHLNEALLREPCPDACQWLTITTSTWKMAPNVKGVKHLKTRADFFEAVQVTQPILTLTPSWPVVLSQVSKVST